MQIRDSGAFLTPGPGIRIQDPRCEKSGSGSGINTLDHFSESLETISGSIGKYLNSLIGIRIRDPESFCPGSWIRNGKIGSGITTPDPQHCLNTKNWLSEPKKNVIFIDISPMMSLINSVPDP
jgi:hypothetical protein